MTSLWLVSVALGQSTGEGFALASDLEKLVAKGQFDKAEDVFRELQALAGEELSVQVWYHGAQAIWATGDVAGTRKRLMAGLAVHEAQELTDWVWDIDERFGGVQLHCDPKSKLKLHAHFEPFDPEQGRAIAYAKAAIEDGCSFEGLLPAGHYQLYTNEFDVASSAPTAVVDLRGAAIDKKQRKALEKEWSAKEK